MQNGAENDRIFAEFIQCQLCGIHLASAHHKTLKISLGATGCFRLMGVTMNLIRSREPRQNDVCL
jgi:hypothetical protein